MASVMPANLAQTLVIGSPYRFAMLAKMVKHFLLDSRVAGDPPYSAILLRRGFGGQEAT